MPVGWKKKSNKVAIETNGRFAIWRSKAGLLGRGEGRDIVHVINAGVSLFSGKMMKYVVLFEWDEDSQMEHCVKFWVPYFLSNASADDVDFFLFVA